MQPKMKVKITVDFMMLVLLVLQMAFMLTGQKVHEWMGAGMFCMFLIHLILNGSWLKNTTKGRYTPYRILQTGINLLVFLCMIGLMVSGIMMSRHVFPFRSIRSGMSFARELHMVSAYWGYMLISAHIGLHGAMFMGMLRKATGSTGKSVVRTAILRLLALLISGYGVAAFIHHNILSYMLLKVQFVFFDFERPVYLFFLEYLAMMGLFAFLAYYLMKAVQKIAAIKQSTITQTIKVANQRKGDVI